MSEGKHTRKFSYYYIPRSSLNPHGTYAIVDTDDMKIEPAGRHHVAEISGFGDGSDVSKRKTPDEVHLFCAAPDLVEALHNLEQAIMQNGEWDDGCFYHRGTSSPELQGPLDAARAALSKATGGAS